MLATHVLLLSSKFTLFASSLKMDLGSSPVFFSPANCILSLSVDGARETLQEGRLLLAGFDRFAPASGAGVLSLQFPMASNQLHSAASSSTHPQAVLE